MDQYEAIAAFYDAEHAGFHDDIDFYLQVLPIGSVLEVGVGTGRVAQPLARAGFEVWGVDPSAAMLDQARLKLEGIANVQLVHGPIETLNVDQRFDSAIMPLNTIWHFLSQDAQIAALRAVRRHLAPNGLLVLDLSNPLTMADRGANGSVRERFSAVVDEGSVTGYSAAWDDEAEQRLTLSLVYDRITSESHVLRSRAQLELRYILRPELELLLRVSGFQLRQCYGSYDLEPFSATAPSLIAVAGAEG
jgi:SAM-dependent methyltransferase